MACPGSVQLSRQVPIPPSTPAAEEGTRAHTLAELTLRGLGDPVAFVGSKIEGGVVTEEMVDAVRLYTDHCRAIASTPGVRYWIERKFSLASLNPGVPMFGTSDFVAYEPTAATLYVTDLKFGAGVLVEVIGSKQLRYYALGALLSLQEEDPTLTVDTVCMTIIQPRMGHADGLIRSEEISVVELLAFAAELLDAARKTQEEAPALNPGPHCRFCPASGICPAQRDHAQALAQIEFSVESPSIPPAPQAMPIEMVVEMLPQMAVLEEWIKACRAHVQARLEAGLEVPGYKLVAKRATRQWTEPAGIPQTLAAMGYDAEEIFDMDLKSPAQIEKLLKKKMFAEKLSHLVEKKSSGHKMVPSSDPAPALVIARGEEFAGFLTDGE